MSFKDCIDNALKEGRISQKKADETLALYDELKADLDNTSFGDMADVEAARRTYEAQALETAEKKRQTLLQVKAAKRVEMNMRQYRNARGEEDFGAAMAAHLSHDDLAPFSNVEGRYAAVRGILQGKMTDFLERFRHDTLGRSRDAATMHDVVREAFGEETANTAAKELAKAWADTADQARQWFNQAGGRIPKRADWGLPQSHDSVAVNKAGYRAWRDYIQPMLDTGKMIDERTGQPFTSEQLEPALKEVYETIRTDGLNKMVPGTQGQAAKLANRRMDHRFLIFKSADDWMAYNSKFGQRDPFSTMMAHIDHMSRDIAALQVLGPNPKATLRYMEQLSLKQGMESGALDRAKGKIKSAWDMWGLHSGTTLAPVNAKLARSMAGVRSFLQSAQLGSSVFSSLTDLSTGRLARHMAGLPEVKMLSSYLKMLNPADAGDRRLAVRLGLGAQGWSTRALAQMRYFDDTMGPEITRRLATAVSTLSGHTAWIQAGRWGFGMEFMGALADHAGETFDRLPEGLQKTMQRYGMDAGRWDVLRSTPMYEHEGAQFLRPEDIAARTDLPPAVAEEHAFRLLEMIESETNYAVPTTNLRGRAAGISDIKPGTLQGELLRSGLMYKSFAVTMWNSQLTRGMLQQGAMSKAGYFAQMAIGATLMGALAIQLKQIARGADPIPMHTPQFWGRAMFQGGGLGIFGDFLGSTTNRFGGGLAETIAGPAVGFATDVMRAIEGNVDAAVQGKKTHFGGDIVHLLRQYTPGGTIWYARAAFERLILDNLQRMVDPDAQDRFRREEQRLRSQYGQRFWWRPGHNTPDRAPDIGNVTGG